MRVQLRKYNGSSYVNHVQADVSADGQQSVSLSTDGSSKFQVRILATTFGSGNYFTLDDFTLSKDSACQIYWSQDTGVYRFGFNGIEKYDELKGTGNSYDFGARIYDSRLGRWLSVDPLESFYPSWSTYNAFMDNPITIVDPDGKGGRVSKIRDPNTGKTIALKVTATIYVYTDVQEIQNDITNIANTIKSEIENNWNNVSNSDETGNGVAKDANGNVLPIIFEVSVIPITRLEAENRTKTGKVSLDENFIELVNNEIPSEFDGNSGVINLNQNKAKNYTTVPHEWGHLLGYRNKSSRNTPDNEFHAGDYNPSSALPVPIMYRSLPPVDGIEERRVVTQTDIDRTNDGRGIGADVMGKIARSAYIGTPNTNQIYTNGIPSN